jgi:hypothetical protein
MAPRFERQISSWLKALEDILGAEVSDSSKTRPSEPKQRTDNEVSKEVVTVLIMTILLSIPYAILLFTLNYWHELR